MSKQPYSSVELSPFLELKVYSITLGIELRSKFSPAIARQLGEALVKFSENKGLTGDELSYPAYDITPETLKKVYAPPAPKRVVRVYSHRTIYLK